MTTRCKQHVILFVTPWSGFSNLSYLSCELEGEVSFCKPLCLGQMQVGRREHGICVLKRITHMCAGALFPGGLRPLNYSSPWRHVMSHTVVTRASLWSLWRASGEIRGDGRMTVSSPAYVSVFLGFVRGSEWEDGLTVASFPCSLGPCAKHTWINQHVLKGDTLTTSNQASKVWHFFWSAVGYMFFVFFSHFI